MKNKKFQTGMLIVGLLGVVFSATAAEPPSERDTVLIYKDVPAEDDRRSESERLFEPYGIMPAERAAQVAVDTSHLLEGKKGGTAVEVILVFKRPTDWQGTYWLLDGGTAWGTRKGINVQQLLNVKPNTKLALRFDAWGNGRVTFKCGGVNQGKHRSSLPFPIEVRNAPVTLSKTAKEYTIGPIEARKLINVIDPLCVVASGLDQKDLDSNEREVRVLIDNIRFEPFVRTREKKKQLARPTDQ